MNEQDHLPIGEQVGSFKKRFIRFFSILLSVLFVAIVLATFFVFQRQARRDLEHTANTIKDGITYLEFHHISNPEHGYRLDEHHYSALQEYVIWIKERNPSIDLIVYYDRSQKRVIGTTKLEWYHQPLSALPEKHIREDLLHAEKVQAGHEGKGWHLDVFDFSYYLGNTLLMIHLDATTFWKHVLFSAVPFILFSIFVVIIIFYFSVRFLKKSIFSPLHNVLHETHEASVLGEEKFKPESDKTSEIKPTFLNIISQVIRNDLNQLEAHDQWIASIIKTHPIPSFMVNSLGEIIFINDRVHAILKKSPEDQNVNWLENVVDEDKAKIQDAWGKQVHELQIFEQEFRLKNTENQSFWVFGQCAALKNRANQTVGFIGTLQPIDRWKK